MVRADGGYWPCRLMSQPTDESRMVELIELHALSDWRAAAWLLDRYYGIAYRDDHRADGVDELADRRRERRAAAE